MPNVDQLSLFVSIVAVVISAVALVRSRKIAEKQLELEQHQADLARKQLEQIAQQERQAELAAVDVQLEGYGTSYELIIQNLGQAEARNVDLEWTSEPPRFYDGDVDSKLPIRRLKPGSSLSMKIALHLGSPTYYEGKVSWCNADGSGETDEFALHI